MDLILYCSLCVYTRINRTIRSYIERQSLHVVRLNYSEFLLIYFICSTVKVSLILLIVIFLIFEQLHLLALFISSVFGFSLAFYYNTFKPSGLAHILIFIHNILLYNRLYLLCRAL